MADSPYRFPSGKHAISHVVEAALREHFNDPRVDILKPAPNTFQVRVRQHKDGPVYYLVKVSQQV